MQIYSILSSYSIPSGLWCYCNMYKFIYEEKIEIVFYIEMQWYCLASPLMFLHYNYSDNEIMLGQIMAWFASNIFVDDVTFASVVLCFFFVAKQKGNILTQFWMCLVYMILNNKGNVLKSRWSTLQRILPHKPRRFTHTTNSQNLCAFGLK